MSTLQRIGGYTGMVATSRVRLARNLRGFGFGKSQKALIDTVWEAIQRVPALATLFRKQTVHAHSVEAQHLVEQHLISPALAQDGGAIIVSEDGGLSILLGEEDHLRIQAMGGGLCPKECLTEAMRLASTLESVLPMAVDDRLGYLTACPSNLGTGLRVSAMLHLPMLTETGGVPSVMHWAARQGAALRGTFGEGTQATGAFYQLSNQVTLGVTEQEITERLIAMAMQLIEAEQKARQVVREQDEAALIDRVARAAGVLMTARRIGTAEAEQCLSDTLLGLQLSVLAGVDPQAVCAAERDMRPATLESAAGVELSAPARDERRATLLRERIGSRLSIVV